MTMAPFDKLFPAVARSESRTIKVRQHDRLPPGAYLLREAYCIEPGCDCRRVLRLFRVLGGFGQATIGGGGWEVRQRLSATGSRV